MLEEKSSRRGIILRWNLNICANVKIRPSVAASETYGGSLLEIHHRIYVCFFSNSEFFLSFSAIVLVPQTFRSTFGARREDCSIETSKNRQQIICLYYICLASPPKPSFGISIVFCQNSPHACLPEVLFSQTNWTELLIISTFPPDTMVGTETISAEHTEVPLRPLLCRLNAQTRADGSAIFTQGKAFPTVAMESH